jgi:flagellar biosynthesis protein FlhG
MDNFHHFAPDSLLSAATSAGVSAAPAALPRAPQPRAADPLKGHEPPFGEGPEIWAVGGGKGGTGKTLVSANLAVRLAQCGERVVAVDADFGGANLHTALGLSAPELTLSDFFHRRAASLEEIAVPTGVPNLTLISGARNSLDAVSLSHFQKERLLRSLRRLPADRVVIDLGAGTSLAMLDLFCAADRPVVVALPEPTSIENLYRFLKAGFFRKLAQTARARKLAPILEWVTRHRSLSGLARPADLVREVEAVDSVAGEWIRQALDSFQPQLIVNQVRHGVDAQLGESIEVACHSFLGIHLEFLGALPYDVCLGVALRGGYPYLLRHYNQPAGGRLIEMCAALCARRGAGVCS